MGIAEHFLSPNNQEMTEVNQEMKSNFYTKIPEYAREYKREYLFIIGMNKELKYFVDNINESTTGLFESHKVDRVKYFMKRFLKGQERGKLQDISNLMLPKYDFSFIEEFYINIEYEIQYHDNPIYLEFYDLIKKLYNKIKIKIVFSDYYGEGQCV